MKICQNRFEVQARGSLEHQARWRRHWKRLKGTTGKFGGGGRSAAQFAPAQKKIQTCKSVRAAADEMCGVSIFLKAGSGSPPGEANTRGQAPPPDFHAISNKRALWLLLSAGGLFCPLRFLSGVANRAPIVGLDLGYPRFVLLEAAFVRDRKDLLHLALGSN